MDNVIAELANGDVVSVYPDGTVVLYGNRVLQEDNINYVYEELKRINVYGTDDA